MFGGHFFLIFNKILIKYKKIVIVFDNSKKEDCKLYGTKLIIKNLSVIKNKN